MISMKPDWTYPDGLKEVLGVCPKFADLTGRALTVRLYHWVRNFAYASTGNRDPGAVLQSRAGSCSGKHILLRDLLRQAGQRAAVVTVEGDFAAGVPAHPSMPDDLQEIVSTGGIRDFHNYVVLGDDAGDIALDATWPDAVARFGFPVNSDWNGEGDTRLALTPDHIHACSEDVAGYKAELLRRKLGETERKLRRRFLDLLTVWLCQMREGRGA